MIDDALCISWVKGLSVTPSPCIAATSNPCLTVNLTLQSVKKDWNKCLMDFETGKKRCNYLGFLSFSTVCVCDIQCLTGHTGAHEPAQRETIFMSDFLVLRAVLVDLGV